MGGSIVVMRHGQCPHNVGDDHVAQAFYCTLLKEEIQDIEQRTLKGEIDNGHTDLGFRQIAQSAQALLEKGITQESVGLTLVSPMRRTQEMVKILKDAGVISGNNVQTSHDIREPCAYGIDGEPTPPKDPAQDRWTHVVNYSAERGGESVQEVEERVTNAYKGLQEAWKRAPDRHVVVLTHGFPSKILLRLFGVPEEKTNMKTAEFRIFPAKEVLEKRV